MATLSFISCVDAPGFIRGEDIHLLVQEKGIPRENIFVDKMSGTKVDRPAFLELQKVLRSGDAVVVESLSRVSRKSADLLQLVDDWQRRGIKRAFP